VKEKKISSIFDKCSMLESAPWPNDASYRKFYFTDYMLSSKFLAMQHK
jgi:hypothetical protein